MEDIKEVVWLWDFGVCMPFCPYCNEPIYEAGTCIFCDKPHKWREGKHKETVVEVGEYIVVQGTGNDVYVYKGGEWVLHASCTKKLSEEELRKFVEHYDKLKGVVEDDESVADHEGDGQG